jgi:tRNA threonylcarbamoyladenosine biosynthesis protein TsaB
MSLILHIETATTVCSVSLAYEGKLLALKEENKGYTHAEHLTLFIEEVMQVGGKSMNELEGVAISMGPGSYTGLRIGVATAKGLCFGLNKPLIAISTLGAMAKGASMRYENVNTFCPMLDARRMEVYTALYNQIGEEKQAISAAILNEFSFEEKLNENEILFFGDGALKFKEVCKHLNAKFDFELKPSAANMINLAYNKFQMKQFEDIAYFEPYYLKEFYTPAAKIIK